MLTKNLEFKSQTVDMDARTFEGYAATWDLDSVGDIIRPGAFQKSIQEAFPKKRIKMLWQHSQPLGMPLEMREDTIGLYVKGKVSKTILGDEALELMRDEVVDRMSIGFMIPQGKSAYNEQGQRIISEVKLMEFSPVTFPANEHAAITGVKNLTALLEGGDNIKNSAQLAHALAELKALVTQLEPLLSTPAAEQPPNQDDSYIKGLLTDLGDYARKTIKTEVSQ